MDGEYGPAATDMRHRLSLSRTITAKWGLRFNPLPTANSGPPFDITVGHDLYDDTLFTGRPGIALSAARPGVVATSDGLLDLNPTPDERHASSLQGRGIGAEHGCSEDAALVGFLQEDDDAPVTASRGTPTSPLKVPPRLTEPIFRMLRTMATWCRRRPAREMPERGANRRR